MNFAIWTAVSSRSQAATDKVSLNEQQERCRQYASGRGWRETAGPFVVPGESRTVYINLRDAEENIPPLRAMLNSAQRHEFDVLLMYDYTRLRELLDPVSRTLAAYGVQLYSLGQPVEPVPPEQMDDMTDTASIVQTVSSITSRAEINALRRRFKLGMPKRITLKGLHAQGPRPYGYRLPPGREFDRGAALIPDPLTSQAVILAKDLFLAGRSLTQIAEEFDRRKYQPSRGGGKWNPDTIRYILKNPYYYGIVRWGIYRRIHDPRTGESRIDHRANEARAVRAVGQHKPLWDEATHRAILAEFKRRGKKYSGKRSHRLSGLLYCGNCGAIMWTGYRAWETNPTGDHNRIYYCSGNGRTCAAVLEKELLPRVAAAIAGAVGRVEDAALPVPEGRRDQLQAALDELGARRDRLTDAYAAGAMKLDEYTRRTAEIDDRARELAAELDQEAEIDARRKERRGMRETLARVIEKIPDYILRGPELEVNAQLRALLSKVVVNGNGDVRLEWG